jgi:retron-type reverse transcriptase
LLALHTELTSKTYKPLPLISFILRDPKTRTISKSHFRDRIVHHALINVLRPIFEKQFIYDSCAGRIGKGTLFALKRFEIFMRKTSRNCKNVPNGFGDRNHIKGYCLKADIKHYFNEVNHSILLGIIAGKIKDHDVFWLTKQILNNARRNASPGGGANGLLTFLRVCRLEIIPLSSLPMFTSMNLTSLLSIS